MDLVLSKKIVDLITRSFVEHSQGTNGKKRGCYLVVPCVDDIHFFVKTQTSHPKPKGTTSFEALYFSKYKTLVETLQRANHWGLLFLRPVFFWLSITWIKMLDFFEPSFSSWGRPTWTTIFFFVASFDSYAEQLFVSFCESDLN